jgi:hypothetical protein
MIPMLDEDGRRVVMRQRVAFLYGQQMVDSIVKPADQVQQPDDNASLATLENNALRMPGGQVLITPTQNHVIHFGYHANDLAQHFQQLQGGQADPQQVLVHAHQAGPHMAQHLQAVQGDPTRKDQVEQMDKAMMNLSKMTDQLGQQVDAAMKARKRNAQPQPDPALVAAMAKVQGELQIKQTKMQGDMHLKAVKQQQQMALKDIGQAHDMRLAAAAA